MPSSEELLEIAERAAAKIELEGARHVPSFSDVEDQCEDEYDELLEAIHDDELFAPVDIQRQEQLVEQIAAALPESRRALIVELADNGALAKVWRSLEPFSRTYLTLIAPGADLAWSAELHAPILTALRARDAEAVVTALERHFAEVSSNMALLLADPTDGEDT